MDSATKKKQKIAAALGNLLEWYDFALYGYFSEEIGKVFFPRFGEGGLLASFVVFAVGFLSRPLGAILFGYLGDRYGRRITLLIVFPLMFFSTAIIGILPTYEQIGIYAQVLLVVVRVLQGMSVGCQYTTSITYLSELNEKKSGRSMTIASSWIFSNLGFILAAIVTYFYLTQVVMYVSPEWQWRIPFLTSLLGIPFLIWQKTYLRETPDFTKLIDKNKVIKHSNPFACLRLFPSSFFVTMAMTAVVFITYYVLFVFLVSGSAIFTSVSRNILIINNIIALTIQTLCMPYFARLTDKIGPKYVFYISASLLLVLIYPSFLGFELHTPVLSLILLSLLGVISAGFCAPVSVMMVDAYPTEYRLSGTSISYNVSVALFGGTAPMIASLLTSLSKSLESSALYIMFWCLISIWAVSRVKNQRQARV